MKLNFLLISKILHLKKMEEEILDKAIDVSLRENAPQDEEEEISKMFHELEKYWAELRSEIEHETGVAMEENIFINLEDGELKIAE